MPDPVIVKMQAALGQLRGAAYGTQVQRIERAKKQRNREIAAIHAAATEVGWLGEDRLAWQRSVLGVESTSDMTEAQRQAVKDRLIELGWKPKRAGRNYGRRPSQQDMDRETMLKKIEALLTDQRLPWGYSEAILRRQRGIADKTIACPIDRASDEELRAVIAALWRHQKRTKAKVGQ